MCRGTGRAGSTASISAGAGAPRGLRGAPGTDCAGAAAGSRLVLDGQETAGLSGDGHESLLAQIAGTSRGESKFSCRRRAAGAARGVWLQGDGGRRQRSGMGLSPSILVAKVAAKLRERNFPSFTLHGHAEGRLPLPSSLWLHHKNLPSFSLVLILVLGLVDGAVAITSHSFRLQKQRASQKQGN